MVKKSLIIVASSLAAMLASIPFGVGPCGPSFLPGAILFYGGGLSFLGGCGTLIVSLFVEQIRNWRKAQE